MLDLSNSSCDFLEMLFYWDCTQNLPANVVVQNVLVSRIVTENDRIRIPIGGSTSIVAGSGGSSRRGWILCCLDGW